MTDRLVNRQKIPADPLKQLALFFLLQRYLCKWGGEQLGPRTPEWRAFRTLFLLTANQEIEPRWRHGEWYDRWTRHYLPRAAECISLIARSHAVGGYAVDSCEADPKFSLQYYNLEQYLFTTVHDEFHRDKQLDAFDFFSIVIWKANRAKSRVAQRLLRGREGMTLDQIVAELTSKLAHAESPEERLKILLSEQYGFRLPIASAILTVLWPDEFTVFDARVCERLREFKSLADTAKFDRLWSDYRRYVDAVKEAIPGDLGLRDKDRVLWARSAAEQLKRDIACNFMHTVDAREE